MLLMPFIAPLLDLRRGLKVVVDVLDSMIRNGVSLARSVELSVHGTGSFGLALFIL